MRELIIGEVIQFGGYRWKVLDIQEDLVLIITEGIIRQKSFNDYKGDVTWADSSIRKYLNNDFYKSFTLEEQEKISPVLNINSDNQWYSSKGGEDTEDHIFLLSIEEVVCKYFGDSSKFLVNRKTNQKYWFNNKDDNNSKRRASFDGHVWWWWLRSPGRDNRRAAYIHGDGNVGIQGNGTYRYNSKNIIPSTGDNKGGVRPALWLKL